MLSKQHITHNLVAFKISSFLGFIPATFTSDGRMEAQKNKPHLFVHYFWLLNAFLYGVFLTIRLGQSLKSNDVPLQALIQHAVVLITIIVAMTWDIRMYFSWGPLNRVMFNDTVALLHPTKRRKQKLTIQEHLTRHLHWVLLNAALVPSGAYYEPRSMQPLYSALPPNCQNEVTFYAGMVYECTVYTFLLSAFNFGIFQHLTFLQACQDKLKNALNTIRYMNTFMTTFLIFGDLIAIRCTKSMERPYQIHDTLIDEHVSQLRTLQLRIEYFNKINPSLLYVAKLECMFEAVVGLFLFVKAVLSDNSSHMAIASAGAAWAFIDGFLYLGAYSRGFQIPDLISDNKRELFLRCRRGNLHNVKLLQKRIRSVPNSAIMVGSFHELGKTSTVEYIHFVVCKVVDLLVTFPAPLK